MIASISRSDSAERDAGILCDLLNHGADKDPLIVSHMTQQVSHATSSQNVAFFTSDNGDTAGVCRCRGEPQLSALASIAERLRAIPRLSCAEYRHRHVSYRVERHAHACACSLPCSLHVQIRVSAPLLVCFGCSLRALRCRILRRDALER
jgi:hypothetical protein